MQNRSVVIIGGGGHTRVLIGILKRAGRNVRGIVTRDESLIGAEIFGVPVIGHEKDFIADATEVTLVNGIGNSASRNGSGLDVRMNAFHRYHARGFAFFPVLSNDAVIQPDVTLGEGVQIMPGAIIQPGAMVGENVIVNTRASVDHDVVIYPHAHIAPGAVLCGGVVIGQETHVGAGAVVIQGVRIGSNVVIGAGAVITRNVPDNAIIRPAASEQVKL